MVLVYMKSIVCERVSILTTLLCTLLIISCTPNKDQKWVGTWSTAQQIVEPHNMPPEPGLNGTTIRQIVQVSLGGSEIRVSLSNAFGLSPIIINATHLAPAIGGSAIIPEKNSALTFNGQSTVTIQPGDSVLSDPFLFDLKPLSKVAITMYVEKVDEQLTGHPGSRTTSFILEGNHISDLEFKNPVTTDHWYIIDAIHVKAPDEAAAIAIIGDSITDGRGSGTNKQNRWPDVLASRLQANDATKNVSVLNHGIGGNCVTRSCLGPSAQSRFERDVINQPGVKWLIILEGVNDIGGVHTEEQAEEISNSIISVYEEMIQKAQANNILVYGGTIMPFGGSFYDRPASESARQMINNWIRNSGKFDAVIDFDTSLADPENPLKLTSDGDDGDGLHPNERGHEIIAESFDLSLFTN